MKHLLCEGQGMDAQKKELYTWPKKFTKSANVSFSLFDIVEKLETLELDWTKKIHIGVLIK